MRLLCRRLPDFLCGAAPPAGGGGTRARGRRGLRTPEPQAFPRRGPHAGLLLPAGFAGARPAGWTSVPPFSGCLLRVPESNRPPQQRARVAAVLPVRGTGRTAAVGEAGTPCTVAAASHAREGRRAERPECALSGSPRPARCRCGKALNADRAWLCGRWGHGGRCRRPSRSASCEVRWGRVPNAYSEWGSESVKYPVASHASFILKSQETVA